MSTIEAKEKKNKEKSGKYDKGKVINFLQIFGRNPLFWFFPIYFEDKLNGYAYEINEEESYYKNNGARFITQTSDRESMVDSKLDTEHLNKTFNV